MILAALVGVSFWRTTVTGFLVSIGALLAVVLFLRRGLSDQLARALETHQVVESQNVRLRTKRDALAEQAQQLQEATTQLETQAAELEEQTMELEATIDNLRESDRQHRERAEETAQLTRRLAEAQRVAQLGYWEIDRGSGAVFWSDEMYALAGLDSAIHPPPTDRFLAAIHPEDRQRIVDVATRAITDLTEFNEQYRLPSIDGSGAWRTVQARGRVMTDNGTTKLIGTVQDITDRVALESQLRRAQKMEAVGQLAGGVAHDFNNILTVIEGYSSLLLSARGPNDPDREDVEEIRRAAARAATLTRQLLAFSRQQVLQPRVLDLNEAIVAIEKMLRRLIGEHIEFRTRPDSAIGKIKADPGQLEQVIVNLTVNARDAMPNGGALTIETSNVVLEATAAQQLTIATGTFVAGPYVIMSVSDTGVGIPADQLERIFDPFYTTKESGKGTGLGLATVHGIVEQSGGHIRVFSQPGSGSTFEIYFPRAEIETPAELRAEATAPAHAGTGEILLVEDDAAVRTVASTALRRAGYTVTVASDGVQALRFFEEASFQPDLVITDMVMPDMGGRDLSNHLRTMRGETPILFMSGYARDTGVYNAGFAPGESFIEKPFTPEELTKKVRDALERKN